MSIIRNPSGNYIATYDGSTVTIITHNKIDQPKEINVIFDQIDALSFLPSIFGPSFLIANKMQNKIALYMSNENFEYSEPTTFTLTEKYHSELSVCPHSATVLFGYITTNSHIFVSEISLSGKKSLIPITIFEEKYKHFSFASEDKIWASQDDKLKFYSLYIMDPIAEKDIKGIENILPSPAYDNYCIVYISANENGLFKCFRAEKSDIREEQLGYDEIEIENNDVEHSYMNCYWSPYGSSFIAEFTDGYYQSDELPGFKWKSTFNPY